jgi:hypothetical protein
MAAVTKNRNFFKHGRKYLWAVLYLIYNKAAMDN